MSAGSALDLSGAWQASADLEEADAALAELEARQSRLQSELGEVQRELRRLRTAAGFCPRCGGVGRRRVRGGLYGEVQQRPCVCAADDVR